MTGNPAFSLSFCELVRVACPFVIPSVTFRDSYGRVRVADIWASCCFVSKMSDWSPHVIFLSDVDLCLEITGGSEQMTQCRDELLALLKDVQIDVIGSEIL